MIPRVFLVDDEVARRWVPFAETRPVGELLFGGLLLRERIERALGTRVEAYLGPAELEGFVEEGAPPVRLDSGAASGEPFVVISSRWAPPLDAGGIAALGLGTPPPEGGARLVVQGEEAGRLVPAASGSADAGSMRSGAPIPFPSHPDLPVVELPGRLVPDPWTLCSENAERIARDLTELFPEGVGDGVAPLPPADGVFRLGDHPISAAEEVEVEPGVVLDARAGPIHLARAARVRGPARVEGPAWIGPGSTLLGGVFAASSCGPVCKLHGEIDSSILLGYVNKAHDGYLGHAVLGRWVNLGAMTTNSDLKNTYGPVRVPAPGGAGEIDTGLIKVGAFLGDHVKTGIGTLLNTGTVVGAGSNLFGGAMPPRWVPPFSWGAGTELSAYRLDAFLRTAERVMARRDASLPASMREMLSRVWDRAHGEAAPGRDRKGDAE